MEVADRLAQLVPHWIEHNESHAQQLSEWAAQARGAGLGEVADSIEAAAEKLAQANGALAHARDRLQL